MKNARSVCLSVGTAFTPKANNGGRNVARNEPIQSAAQELLFELRCRPQTLNLELTLQKE